MLVGTPSQSNSTVFKDLMLNVGRHAEPNSCWMLVGTLSQIHVECWLACWAKFMLNVGWHAEPNSCWMLVGTPSQSNSTVFKYLMLNVGRHTEPKQLYCSYNTWMLVGTLKPRACTALTMSLSRWRSSKLLSAPFDSNAGFCKTFSNWYLVMIEIRTDM